MSHSKADTSRDVSTRRPPQGHRACRRTGAPTTASGRSRKFTGVRFSKCTTACDVLGCRHQLPNPTEYLALCTECFERRPGASGARRANFCTWHVVLRATRLVVGTSNVVLCLVPRKGNATAAVSCRLLTPVHLALCNLSRRKIISVELCARHIWHRAQPSDSVSGRHRPLPWQCVLHPVRYPCAPFRRRRRELA